MSVSLYAATEGQAECDETNCPAGKGIRTTVDYDTPKTMITTVMR